MEPDVVFAKSNYGSQYNADFSNVTVREGGLLSHIGNHEGITLGDFINIDAGQLGNDGLLGHELWHVLQYRASGFGTFLINFLIEEVNAPTWKNAYECAAQVMSGYGSYKCLG